MSGLNEKCAVAGVSLIDADLAALDAEKMLFALQHRGTEASGIAYEDVDGNFDAIRGPGMVKDVYPESLTRLFGRTAVGHNRYATSGPKADRAQPVIDAASGFALGHNGNLPVVRQLTRYLDLHNIRTKGRTDSEMMGAAITEHIHNGHDLPDAIELAYPMFRGAFTCTAMLGDTMVAFKDSRGIRPGVIGSTENGLFVASETAGLNILGAEFERDINPGELVVIRNGKLVESRQLGDGKDEKFDIFEIIYFMRSDSLVKGEFVYEKRYRSGQELAAQHGILTNDPRNVIVLPIPDTSIPAAEGYAEDLGLRHRGAIVKNRYIGRTFMEPTNGDRESQLRLKHNIIDTVITGRDIVLVDDSIVRLKTLPNLVKLVHGAGARSVSVLIASPPIRFPDFYGIDTPSQSELAAANMTVEQMREKIGANYLGFLSLDGLIRSTNMPHEGFNLSCFTGEYPIGIGHRKDEIRTPVSMEYID